MSGNWEAEARLTLRREGRQMADTVGKRLVMDTEVDGEIVEVAMRDYFELIRMHATAINHGDGLPVAAITADDDPLELRKARVTERRRKALARAVDVLGSREKALHWLRSPNRAMGGSRPNALVERDEGLKQVEEVLGRIEYGFIADGSFVRPRRASLIC